ncbi:MAG TPA: MXAN_5187 C-terminal domain-containing protein [Geobacteraceae bacterium]
MGIPEDVALFEQSLSELVIKYEQYFLGLEKREPLRLLTEVEGLARRYQGFQIINTMVKFKYNAAIARLNSYKQYWTRINRQIEEGRYSRDRFKMEMHEKGKDAGQPERGGHPAPEEKSGIPPEIEAVYRTYLEARKACRLPVDNVTPEAIAAAIEKQKPIIMNKYHCKGVEFKVVIEDGTPKIKARPKL